MTTENITLWKFTLRCIRAGYIRRESVRRLVLESLVADPASRIRSRSV